MGQLLVNAVRKRPRLNNQQRQGLAAAIFKWRNMQVNNAVGARVRGTQINAVFVKTEPVRQTIFNKIYNRTAKRHERFKRVFSQTRKAGTEKFLGGNICVGNLLLKPDRQAAPRAPAREISTFSR